MTITEAREIIKRDAASFDPFEALMNPDYMAEYTEACNVEEDWKNSHGVSKAGRIFYKKRCRKCGGVGKLLCYDHIDNGRCWNCDGRGYIEIYH